MKKNIIAAVVLLIAVALAGFGFYSYKSAVSYTPTQNLNAPIEIPDVGIVTMQEVSEEEVKPVVALYYADWCTYCRRFMPDYGKIAKKYKDKFVFAVVNCDYPENEEYVRKAHIIGFPSLFVIDKKLGHTFALNPASTADNSVIKEELDNYFDFRNKIISKISDK